MEGWFAKMKQMAVDAAGEAEAAAERLKREAQDKAEKMKQMIKNELVSGRDKVDNNPHILSCSYRWILHHLFSPFFSGFLETGSG